MDWNVILDAMDGRTWSLERIVWRACDERAALATLLLLEETPHPTAALVAVATIPGRDAPPIQAALAPHGAPALAAWRADPQWPGDAVGAETRRGLTCGVADLVGVLRADPAARRDAVAVVLRDGDDLGAGYCLKGLGADGWSALDADLRAALLQNAPADAHGRVWDALTDAQRAAAVQAASSRPSIAARLIGAIGAAWTTTDPALRERLIDAVARNPWSVHEAAPAWSGMTDDERVRVATSVIASGRDWRAFKLLDALGYAGCAPLSTALRAEIETRAQAYHAWRVLALRAADAGWTALSAKERDTVAATVAKGGTRVAEFLRIVGVTGWNALRADERARLAAVVRCAPDALVRCPPALWVDLAGADLPPATKVEPHAARHWRAEDVDADLGRLPPPHQALVLALAPWRPDDVATDSVRIQRLRAAWDQTPADERVALATAHPTAPAVVAAVARMSGGMDAGIDAVGETVVRIAMARGGARAATRAVGGMLRASARWRPWMGAFPPADDDPPETWAAWIAAARRGGLPDLAVCARLAAKEREDRLPTGALRRA